MDFGATATGADTPTRPTQRPCAPQRPAPTAPPPHSARAPSASSPQQAPTGGSAPQHPAPMAPLCSLGNGCVRACNLVPAALGSHSCPRCALGLRPQRPVLEGSHLSPGKESPLTTRGCHAAGHAASLTASTESQLTASPAPATHALSQTAL